MQIWGAENTADYQANGVGGAIRGVVAEAGSPGLCGLARLGAVSGARIPQLMNLRNLAPTIQERILTKAEGQRTPMPTKALCDGSAESWIGGSRPGNLRTCAR
jgi:hypothetical protein